MTLSLWSAQDCGLLNESGLEVLAGISTVVDGGRAEDGSTTYLVGEPAYIPYNSKTIPYSADGYGVAEDVMRAVFSTELRDSVLASPVARVTHRVATLHATALWQREITPAAGGLAMLARFAPHKGGEVLELWNEYRRRNPAATDIVMVMRDFWGSIYAFQFIRGCDARLLDLSGSVHCLSTAVDYPGASHDSGGGDLNDYMAGASEGLALLAGDAVAQAIRELAVVGATMRMKNALTERITGSRALAHSAGVTPAEFMRARWWDAEMAPYYRTMLGASHYRGVSEDNGTFRSAARCHAIKRAVDNLLRYNEIVDAVPDWQNRECFNEFLVALATGGHGATRGYGTALAEVTDAVLDCRCGADGHDIAAELSMGGCLWYLLVPRYAVRRQLAAFSAATPLIRSAFSITDSSRSMACVLPPGEDLHHPDWTPMWRPGPTRPPVERARRMARRSFVDSTKAFAYRRLAQEVLDSCDRMVAVDDLRRLTGAWRDVFDAALDATGTGSAAPAASLRDVIGRIWNDVVLGRGTGRHRRTAVHGRRRNLAVDVRPSRRRWPAPAAGVSGHGDRMRRARRAQPVRPAD